MLLLLIIEAYEVSNVFLTSHRKNSVIVEQKKHNLYVRHKKVKRHLKFTFSTVDKNIYIHICAFFEMFQQLRHLINNHTTILPVTMVIQTYDIAAGYIATLLYWDPVSLQIDRV